MVNVLTMKNNYYLEYGFAFSATLSLLAAGATLVWTSPSLPILMHESQERPITPDEGSWIVSLLILASAFSPLPTAFIVDMLGRKLTLLLATVPSIASWIIIMITTTPEWLYVARLISGFNYGVVYTVVPLYLGEISSKEVRGSVGILITVMAKLGVLFTYCIGPYVSILEHASIQILIPIAFVLTFMWSPESPYYLLLRNKEDEAERSLQRLRGRTDVRSELDLIAAAVKLEQQTPRSFRQLFETKGNRRGVIAIMALGSCMQLCGSQAVLAYAQQIFTEADVLDPKLGAIFLGLAQLSSTVMTSILVDRVGRRPLLILSASGVSVMTAAIGLYFFVKDFLQLDVTNINWLPIVLIVVYIVLYNIGLPTVTFMMIGELFPTNVKAIASCLAITWVGLLSFAVTKLYQVITDSLGAYVAFWIFCFCSVISLIFIVIYVPETKGKTLAQIQIDMNAISANSNNAETKM